MPNAQYILVSGFLGAGKTTAILQMAKLLRAQGKRVGLITNDQSYGLVDTGMLAAHDFSVEEITGGCFCCRFNSLVEASERLEANTQPDVFIAEPVGSCTDLKATVDYPLRRMYGDSFDVAPLSVLVDPTRAERVLGIDPGKTFSEKVIYIYRKQLEEAEIIVVNKLDLLTAERAEALQQALRDQYPNAQVLAVSARSGAGIDTWLDLIQSSTPLLSGAMEVDYDTYADGEALLGWLNAALTVSSDTALDGHSIIAQLSDDISSQLESSGIEIAHLKMTLTPSEGSDIAVANKVSGERALEFSHRLDEELTSGELIVNLRAEGDPEHLRECVTAAVERVAQAARIAIEIQHLESFRPGRPTPTHRLSSV